MISFINRKNHVVFILWLQGKAFLMAIFRKHGASEVKEENISLLARSQ